MSAPPRRVLGSMRDLVKRVRRPEEQRLADVLTEWSLDANHAWLLEGVRRNEPFLQISTVPSGSILAWELTQLQAEGYVGIGPFWVPLGWLREPEGYRRLVELVARHLLARSDQDEPLYSEKASAELIPLLELWPHALALPTSQKLTIDELIVARAWPVHALGVASARTLGDGHLLSPAEFFFHDLDHARFKIREDLLARGRVVPDAYVNGTTYDAARGEHRTFLATTKGQLDSEAWRCAAERSALARALLSVFATEHDRDLGEAARWLLFELVHEKSFPLDPTVLLRELATNRHVEKLEAKSNAGFFGDSGPRRSAMTLLPAARGLVVSLLDELSR